MKRFLPHLFILVISVSLGFLLGQHRAATHVVSEIEANQIEQKPFEAVLRGDEAQLQTLLDSAVNADHRNSAGETLLHVAASTGNRKMVEMLLEHGADFTLENNQEQTPLAIAVLADDIAVIKELIEAGASTSETIILDGVNVNLVEIAVANSSFEALALLDQEKAQSVQEDLMNVQSGLKMIDAAKVGDTILIRELVDEGSDLNFNDENSWSPLTHAAANGFSEAVNLLIESGAEINAQTPNGMTPLHVAVLGNHVEVVRSLVESGADQTILAEGKYSPYELAQAQGSFALLTLLEKPNNGESRPNIFSVIQNGDVGLAMSLFKGDWQLMKTADADGWSPLMHAIEADQTEIALAILQDASSEANRYSPDGVSPLVVAAMKGNSVLVEELLEEGAALEYRIKGVSIPEIAAKNGHQSLSNYLDERLKLQTRSLQRELNLFGQVPGPWDGLWGDGTRRAVEEVKKNNPETARMNHAELVDWLYDQNSHGIFYCNHTKKDNLWFVLAYTSSAHEGGISSGWYKVGRYECRRKYIGGSNIIAFTHASGRGGSWGRGDAEFCIRRPDGFRIEHPVSCNGDGYERAQFSSWPFGGGTRRIARMVE